LTSCPPLDAPGPKAPGAPGRPSPGAPELRARTLALALALASLGPWPLPAWAEPSRTAESIWSQEDASQRALQLVPAGAQVNSTSCQEIGVGSMGGLPRFRCTVRFSPSGASPGGASPGGANP
jgi:hypothetical protein